MRNAFVNTLLELAKQDEKIILMTGDLGFSVLDQFAATCPNRFINAGIAEQNMATVAAGIALEGKTVFIYSIGNFSTLRCIEQIRNDIAYHNANVKVVSIGGGFAYGSLGMSHHSTEDIAIMRALPDIKVFTPCDLKETIEVTKLVAKTDGPCYIRLGKGGEKNLHVGNIKVSAGKAISMRLGKDVAIFACGSIAEEALEAAEILQQSGISCAVYSFPTVKPIDEQLISDVSKTARCIFTLEEHNPHGGFGSAVCEVVSGMKTHAPIVKFSIGDRYLCKVGSQKYLRQLCGLDAPSIAKSIRETLGAD